MSRYVVAIALIMAVVLPAVQMKEEESKCCPKNSSWAECGTVCEPSCDNPNPTFCPRVACGPAIAACRCNDGLVRDNKSGDCIKLECCPKPK